MAKAIILITSTALFTLIGLGASALILANRPPNFSDREGFITTIMVLVPTGGGMIAGFAVGYLATPGK